MVMAYMFAVMKVGFVSANVFVRHYHIISYLRSVAKYSNESEYM